MAVPRNYRVLRGQRGTEARTKYLAYLQGLALPDKTNTVVKPRAAKKVLYITPFTVSLGADTFLEATALSDAYTKLGLQQVKDRSAEALTDTQKSLKLRGSKAARVSATEGVNPTGTYKRSEITGLFYINYPGASHSVPFGKKTAQETEQAAFADIKDALNNVNRNVHLIPERI